MLGDILDVGTGFASNVGALDKDTAAQVIGGGTGRQSTSGFVPGVGMIDDLMKGTLGGQFAKLPKLVPGANLPFVAPLITAIEPEKN
jgi:hypothetical protein